jgi:hypothetical protein
MTASLLTVREPVEVAVVVGEGREQEGKMGGVEEGGVLPLPGSQFLLMRRSFRTVVCLYPILSSIGNEYCNAH